MRIALASLMCLAGCRSSTAPSTPIAHHADVTPQPAVTPVIETPAGSDECPLRWDELADAAPPTIELTPIASGDPRVAADANDSCPGFDPASMHCAGGVDCNEARMRGDHRAVLTTVGPGGSGRFVSMGLAIDGRAFACMTASTVGWRNLYLVGKMLAPLPWLADVDGDKEAELVVWTRLPWGDAEVTNALMPVVYVLDGDRLVRRDDRSHALRRRVSSAYRALAAKTAKDDEQRACYASVATALGA